MLLPPSSSSGILAVVVVVVLSAIAADVRAFQLRPLPHRRPRNPTALRYAEGDADGDGAKKASSPPDPLASLIGGLDAVPATRPTRLDVGFDYDRDAVRSAVRSWIANAPVLVISASNCPYCDRVKDVFRTKGVLGRCRVEEVDDRTEVRAELKELVGRSSVPAVFVGGEYVGGCNDGGRGGVLPLEAKGELDGLLSDAGVLPPRER